MILFVNEALQNSTNINSLVLNIGQIYHICKQILPLLPKEEVDIPSPSPLSSNRPASPDVNAKRFSFFSQRPAGNSFKF